MLPCLQRCLYCPNAYHLSCIPPTAKFHELALLCHDHANTHKLPDLDMEHAVQADVEKELDAKMGKFNKREKREQTRRDREERDKKILAMKQGIEHIPFFEGLNIRELRKNAMPFCLPVDFRDAVRCWTTAYSSGLSV